MLLEIATIYAGELYGVNPLDQPGVELGKQFTYAMLGRPDAEQARQEWNLLPKPEAEVQRLRLAPCRVSQARSASPNGGLTANCINASQLTI